MAPPTRLIPRQAFKGKVNSGDSQGDHVTDLSCVGGCGFELVGELGTIALSQASAQPTEIGLELLSHPALSADQLREFR